MKTKREKKQIGWHVVLILFVAFLLYPLFYAISTSPCWWPAALRHSRCAPASLLAYGLVFFRFRGRNVLHFFLISTMFIPFTVTMIPTI